MGSSSHVEAPMCDPELPHAQKQTSDHWGQVFALINESDKSMYELRKQDLDNQYHAAMYFSSFLVMIFIDSYKWLTQYASHSIIAHCLLASPPNGEFISFHMAVIINLLWFLSLLLTLSAILSSYACSYYLREFRNLPQFEAKHLLAFRQMRYRFLRKWKVFVICDMIHMILPSAMLLAFFGLVLLFRALDHPGSCVVAIAFGCIMFCILLLGTCPLLFSIFSRRNAPGISPFPSPLSWLLFKSGYRLLFLSYSIVDLLLSRRDKTIWQPRARLSYPFRQPKSLRDTLKLALISGDWLEQDCSSFLDRDNADAIDVLLADALVWIDQRPTIEKSSKIVEAIYHCILDLDSPHVFAHLKDGLESDGNRVAWGRLAAVFYAISKERELNIHDARLLASKRWLEEHARHLPRHLQVELARSHLKCMKIPRDKVSHTEYGLDSLDGLLSEHYPADSVLQILTEAKNDIASGTDLERTSNFVEQTKDPRIKDDGFEERERFSGPHDGRGRSSRCPREFTRTFNDICICEEMTGAIWISLPKCLCGAHNCAKDLQTNDGRFVVGYSTPVPCVSRADSFASDASTQV